jgi:hypothetical protein
VQACQRTIGGTGGSRYLIAQISSSLVKMPPFELGVGDDNRLSHRRDPDNEGEHRDSALGARKEIPKIHGTAPKDVLERR